MDIVKSNELKVNDLVEYIIELSESYFLIEAGVKEAILNISDSDKNMLLNHFEYYEYVKPDSEFDVINTVYGTLHVVTTLPNNKKPIITPKR